MNRWWIACCLVAISATARAGGLAWHAPSECPDDAAVRKAIERRLEAPLDSVALAVEVEITHDASGFAAQVRVPGTDDRTLTSASCDELTDAVAVVVARLATEARAVAPPPPPVIVTPLRPEPPPPPIGHARWNAGVRTTAIVGSGNVPSIGAAGELAAWLGWDHAFIELALARWLTRRAIIDDATMAGVDVQLDTFTIRGGGHFGIVRVWLGGEYGRLEGNGFGLTAPHGGSGSWKTAGGGGAVAFRLAPHLRGVVSLDLEIAFDRVQFALDSGEVIYRTSAVALRGGVGIELDWH